MTATGWPILEDGEEDWTEEYFYVTGNLQGDVLVGGKTDHPDPTRDSVVVLNQEVVFLREGDPVDLDGNGEFDDDVFIQRFNLNTSCADPCPLPVSLTDRREFYFLATLRDGEWNDLGSAFLVASLREFVRGDCNGSGATDIADPIAFLGFLFSS